MAGIAPTRRIAIALGSNVDSILGTRSEHLNAALRALDAPPRTVVTASSRFIETEPVGPIGQGRYLNAAACLDTTLEPAALLARLLEIERERGRDRSREARWGPRTLDLDLLLYEDHRIDEPGLTVPHPRLHERAFVLEPLSEIAGDWVVPGLGGRTVAMLWASLRAGGR